MRDSLYKITETIESAAAGSLWLWYSADGSDRLFDRFITTQYSSPTYLLVSDGRVRILVSSLDSDVDFGIETLVYGGKAELAKLLSSELAFLGWPTDVYLNYSKSGDHKVDSLGHGTYNKLRRDIVGTYLAAGRLRPKLRSAEELFYLVAERRSPLQIERMEIAANRAQDILLKAFGMVRVGMSEHEIYRLVQRVMRDSRSEVVAQHGIVDEAFAWEEASCPIVLVGPNLSKGGHAETTDYRVKSGETLYADFGVKHTYSDGETVSSDLQRMGYLPVAGEIKVPDSVQAVFDTLVSSISQGIAAMRPGVSGYEIDTKVRGVITGAGYPSYDHSTGHPIGEVAHNPGTLLGSRGNPRSRRKLQLHGTYTVEPRCQVENGGSIEEMVLVTNGGGRTLCPRQTELFVVGRGT